MAWWTWTRTRCTSTASGCLPTTAGPSRSPILSSGAVLGRAADAGAAETDRAIAAAAAALPAWRRTTAYARAAVLWAAHDLMVERTAELAAVMTAEQGKPLKAARNEVRYAADLLSWFAEEAKRVYGSTIPSSRPDQRLSVLRQPVGVVAGTTPWNYPISMITRKVAPALAAGGKALAARAAATLKRVSMELGGHAPMIVFDDADPVHAAKGTALVKFLNTGQACISPNRVSVQRSVFDAFAEALVDRVQKLRVGPGTQEGVGVGPLLDDAALEKVQRQVTDAVDRGARLLTGGGRLTEGGPGAGRFFAPSVLADVDESMSIYREKTFGPVAALCVFDDEDEVVRRANDTEYGLASYVYTRDLGRAVRVSEALEFGIVGINDVNPTAAAGPVRRDRRERTRPRGWRRRHRRVPRREAHRTRCPLMHPQTAPPTGEGELS